MKRLFVLVLLLTPGLFSTFALDRGHFDTLNKNARELREQQNWQGLREILLEMRRELPSATPRYLLRMASAETHLGHTAAALDLREQYAAMGLHYDVAKDDDLKSLISEPGFSKIAASMKRRTAAISRAEQVCVLSQVDVMPEDIAFERSSGTFIVSSIQHHTLYRVSLPGKGAKECTVTELPLPQDAKRWPSLAVSADPTRNVLWMTASAMPGFTGFPKGAAGKAALIEIDPASGKVLHQFLPEATGPLALGDMSVSHDGSVLRE